MYADHRGDINGAHTSERLPNDGGTSARLPDIGGVLGTASASCDEEAIEYDPRFDRTSATSTPESLVDAVRGASPRTIRAMTPLTAAATRTVMTPVTVMLPELSTSTWSLPDVASIDAHDPPLVTMLPPDGIVDGPGVSQDDKASSYSDVTAAATFTNELCPLSVVLEPKRPRNCINFGSTNRSTARAGPAKRLSIFEHVDGCAVCANLFGHYRLPNGRLAHFYLDGKMSADEELVDLDEPPPRPRNFALALQLGLPPVPGLAALASPIAVEPPALYVPRPALAPTPDTHTLNVKHPTSTAPSSFGDLAEMSNNFGLTYTKVTKVVVTQTEEAISKRPPWDIYASVFAPRIKEADCRAFYDCSKSEKRMFTKDWARLLCKSKFRAMIVKEDADSGRETAEETIAALGAVMSDSYGMLYEAFCYFAALGNGGDFSLQLNEYSNLMDDCGIPLPESEFCKRSDLDTIFIATNYKEDRNTVEAKLNDDNSLIRFEYIEALVRIAVARFTRTVPGFPKDVCLATNRLITEVIQPNMPPEACVDSNVFLRNRLYFEEMDVLYEGHLKVLKAIYSRYRTRRARGGGPRNKQIKMDDWMRMLDDAGFIDDQFALRYAKMCFVWGRMHVFDELKSIDRLESLTFVDFLEALGRAADMKHLPSAEQLEECGYSNAIEYLDQLALDGVSVFIPHRESDGFLKEHVRPLHARAAIFLDTLFRRLDRGRGFVLAPGELPPVYSEDGLYRKLAKMDKDLDLGITNT